MRVFKINTNPEKYSSNVYLVLGNWGTIDDTNVLIDTGIDDYILRSLEKIYTGVGKKSVDTVILTHNHFDHTGGLKCLIDKYNPKILANYNEKFITRRLNDQDQVKIGEVYFTVYKMPSHSQDSIVLFNCEHGILFSGDTNFDIKNRESTYAEQFLINFEAIAKKGVSIIYPGHGSVITEGIDTMLNNSLKNLKQSKIENGQKINA